MRAKLNTCKGVFSPSFAARPAAFGGGASATSPPPSSATSSWWWPGGAAGANEVTGASEVALRSDQSMVARLEARLEAPPPPPPRPRPSPRSGRGAGRGGTLTEADLRKNLSLC